MKREGTKLKSGQNSTIAQLPALVLCLDFTANTKVSNGLVPSHKVVTCYELVMT